MSIFMVNWMLNAFFWPNNEFLWNNEIFHGGALEGAGGWC